jgi:dynein heavy chain
MSNNPFSLQEWYDMNETQLGQLTELVRGKLTSLQRKIIVALVTTDVHARDIIEDLVKSNVQSVYDFAWQQQLRYYWDEEIDNCLVK